MDYQGNYFPEEHDENESKTYRTIKGIFKWTMYGISFFIYAVIFYIMIVNKDSKILEKNYMAEQIEENIQTDTLEMYRINTRVFMNDDGSLQILNTDYYAENGYVEIGIKYNTKKLTNGSSDNVLKYSFYDSNGKTYPLVNAISDSGGRYGFQRICFSEVEIDLNSNDLRYDTENPIAERSGTIYYLDIIRASDNEKLFTFEVYNNKTTFTKTDYND